MSIGDPCDFEMRVSDPEPAPTFADMLDDFDGASGAMQLIHFRAGRGEVPSDALWDQTEQAETDTRATLLAELDRLTDGNAERLLRLFDAPGFN